MERRRFAKMVLTPCADPGIFAREVHARLPGKSSDNVYFTGSQCFISKKTIMFSRFQRGSNISRGGGGPTFFTGVQLFPGGGGGSKC